MYIFYCTGGKFGEVAGVFFAEKHSRDAGLEAPDAAPVRPVYKLPGSARIRHRMLGTRRRLERLSTKASRQSTLGYTHGSSLSVDGAQATNSMVTQDTDKLFIQVRPPCGRNTYVLRLVVLICVEIIVLRGVPCPSLYSPEGRVTNLETHPSRLQLP